MNEIQQFIQKLARQQNLTIDETSRAFQIMMLGGATPAQIASVLTALRMKGEITDELVGAALAIRSKSGTIKAPEGTIDICGTGSDGPRILNVSTASAFVTAAAGIPVAKHGNRTYSSLSSSNEVLRTLGVNLEKGTELAQKCLESVGICFMTVPKFQSAMRHVLPIGEELGIRTIFNLLGPLANPAETNFQLIGVYDRAWLKPMAHALKHLGTKSAWVVTSEDGLDEISTCAITHVAELKDEEVSYFELSPVDYGIAKASISDLYGGNLHYNVEELRAMLGGAKGPYRDIVVLNSAAAIYIAGKTETVEKGIQLAELVIDTGKASEVLQKLIEITQQ